jgi:accessory colonization factor AcfC
MVQGIIAQSDPAPGFDNSAIDGVLIGMLANRGAGVQTSSQFEPSGNWSTKEEMLSELESSRKNLVEYLSNTDSNLRDYKAALPFGEIDTYQLFLIMSAHSQRHTFQIQEVLAEMEGM